MKKLQIPLLVMVFISMLFICFQEDTDLENIALGVFSSALVVLLLELFILFSNRDKTKYLAKEYKQAKEYKRVAIFAVDHEATSGSKYKKLDYSKVDAKIKIKRISFWDEYEFSGEVTYENGPAKFQIRLSETNPNYGEGIYEYDNPEKEDVGTYKLIRSNITEDKTRLYIYYSNLIGNGLAEGYEIWEADKP